MHGLNFHFFHVLDGGNWRVREGGYNRTISVKGFSHNCIPSILFGRPFFSCPERKYSGRTINCCAPWSALGIECLG